MSITEQTEFEPLEAPAPEADEQVEKKTGLTHAQINSRKRLNTLLDQAKKLAHTKGIRMIAFYESHDEPFKVQSSVDPMFIRGVVSWLAIAANQDFNEAVRSLHQMVGTNPDTPNDQPTESTGGDQEQPVGDAGVREAPRD